MSRKLIFSLPFFVLSAGTTVFAQYVLTCASEDGRRHYCSADTRGGVTMQRQRSGSPCTQGTTWGFDQNGVWVDRGCRADFMVNTKPSDSNHDRDGDRERDHDRDRDRRDWQGRDETLQLTCSSDDGGRHYCESDIQGKATLTRQRSGSPCREGYSWGYDRRGVWVDHGCRADFQLLGQRRRVFGGGSVPGYVGTVKCSSNVGTREYCEVDTRGGVRVTRQISQSACRLGYSWGYDRDGIWVDHGCRAEFQVGR